MGPYRFLFYTVPNFGDFGPFMSVATSLHAQGHEVVFVTTEERKDLILQSGLAFEAMEDPVLKLKSYFFSGTGRLTDWVTRYFRAIRFYRQNMAEAVDAASRLISKHLPHCIYAYQLGFPMLRAAQTSGVPWATGFWYPMYYNVESFYYLAGMPTPVTAAQKIRHVLFRAFLSPLLSLTRGTRTALFPLISPYLHLFHTAKEFDFPRRELPPQAHYVGPALWDLPMLNPRIPEWINDLPENQAYVFVVWTTSPSKKSRWLDFYGNITGALADLPVRVILTTPWHAEIRKEGSTPENFLIAEFIPTSRIIRKVACVVHNGGYGITHFALVYGIPQVFVTHEPLLGDSLELAQRCVEHGVAVKIPESKFNATRLRKAVLELLHDGRYKANAERVRSFFHSSPGQEKAAELLTRLASNKTPVLCSPETA